MNSLVSRLRRLVPAALLAASVPLATPVAAMGEPPAAVPHVTAGPGSSSFTVAGAGFGTATPTVTFSRSTFSSAATLTKNSATSITATSPASGPTTSQSVSGAVDVTVNNGTYATAVSSGYTYGPQVSKVTTSKTGTITIAGKNFGTAAPTVKMIKSGYVQIVVLTKNSDTSLTLTVPTSIPDASDSPTGEVDIQIAVASTPAYKLTLSNAYSFGAKITKVATSSTGVVTVTGTGFGTGATAVLSKGAYNQTISAPTKATTTSVVFPSPTAPTPAQASSGVVDLTINAVNGAQTYSYTSTNGFSFGPKVTKVASSATAITITGTGFGTTTPTVNFSKGASASAPVPTKNSATSITLALADVDAPDPTDSPTGAMDLTIGANGYSVTSSNGFSFGPSITKATVASTGVVTIAGKNFGSTPTGNFVKGAYSQAGTPTKATATSLVMTPPTTKPTAGQSSSGAVDLQVVGDTYTATLSNGYSFGPTVKSLK